jgi:hypothetical protein
MEEKIIQEVIKKLKGPDRIYQITDSLKRKGLSDQDADLYLETAQKRINGKKVNSLPRTNKIIFCSLVIISLVTLILFLFVLPNKGFTQTTIISIFGSVIFVSSTIYARVYYNSWKDDEIRHQLDKSIKKDPFPFHILIPIPAVIMFFIFSWIMESGADNVLKANQIETEGIIISTSSTDIYVKIGKSVNLSSVTVEFKTGKGEVIRAKEDISEYEFKNFVRGQKVRLIYSSSNPQNIALLNSKSAITKFTGSAERDFEATDLIDLINISDDEQTLSWLNSITYGWQFDRKDRKWKNSLKNMVFTRSQNKILLVTGEIAMFQFPKQFLELDFKDITVGGIKNQMMQGQRSLENKEFSARIKRISVEQERFVVTTLERK